MGAIEEAEVFGWRLYDEALRRRLMDAARVVVLADGAKWIRNLVEMHFPQALLIIDLYHARERSANLCKRLGGNHQEWIERTRARWWDLLDQNEVETIIEEALHHLSLASSDVRKEARTDIHYLENNKDSIRYATFRAQRLFVDSGVSEAGCKSLIGHRLKQSGMKWSLRAAIAIISLRCMMKSDRLEDYWEDRRVA